MEYMNFPNIQELYLQMDTPNSMSYFKDRFLEFEQNQTDFEQCPELSQN
jgi:hypothetical protein